MIQLGATADTLRTYNLNNPLTHRRQTANPFAPGVSNQGAFSKLDGWAESAIAETVPTIGRKKPESGAWKSSTLTMFPNQVTLPPMAHYVGASVPPAWADVVPDPFAPSSPFYVFDISSYGLPSAGTWTISINVKKNGEYPFSLTARTFAGAIAGINFVSDSPIETAAETYTKIDLDSGNNWIEFTFSNIASPPDWVCITLSNTTSATHPCDIWVGDNGITAYTVLANGTTETATDYSPVYSTSLDKIADYGYLARRRPLAIFNGKIYRIALYDDETAALFVEDFSAPNGWTKVDDLPYRCYALVPWGSTLYIAQNGANALQMNTSETVSDSGFVGRMMHAHAGYLWRVDGNRVIYYTNDPSSGWTTVGALNPATNTPTAMAGLGNRLYISTPESLVCVEEGDFITYVTNYTDPSNINSGRSLIAIGDTLYEVIDQQTIYSIDSAHQIRNIMQDNQLFIENGWKPGNIFAMQDFVCVAIDRRNTNQNSAIYAYRNGEWHFLCEAPTTSPLAGIWDKLNDKLVVIDRQGNSWYYTFESLSIAPQFQSSFKFTSSGWLEFGKFYGDRLSLQKEWYSVILSLTLRADTNVTVYYTTEDDADSETKEGWTALPLPFTPEDYETAQEIITEVVFSERISSHWIKIAVELTQEDATNSVTPIVEAIVLRYLPMVTDYWQWNLEVSIGDNQQLSDGTIIPYTAEQQREHLTSLVKQDTMMYFRDIDNRLYACKVLSSADQPTSWDQHLDAHRENIPYIFQLALQQFEEVAE